MVEPSPNDLFTPVSCAAIELEDVAVALSTEHHGGFQPYHLTDADQCGDHTDEHHREKTDEEEKRGSRKGNLAVGPASEKSEDTAKSRACSVSDESHDERLQKDHLRQ